MSMSEHPANLGQGFGIRFDNGPKIHYVSLDAQHADYVKPRVQPGVACVVQCRRGLELATIRTPVCVLEPPHTPIGNFVRIADANDIANHQTTRSKAEDLKWLMRAKVREDRLKVKIVHLEFDLEERTLVVSYYAEDKVQLRPYIALLTDYTHARIEFRSVGARDQARIIGALGVCGDGSCSSTWLQNFHPVSIKMARDQQLPLNADKISGPCGRLMCCLAYEHPMYEELLRDMPRRGTKMCSKSKGSCGVVAKVFPLSQSVELHHRKGRDTLPVSDLLSVEAFDAEQDS